MRAWRGRNRRDLIGREEFPVECTRDGILFSKKRFAFGGSTQFNTRLKGEWVEQSRPRVYLNQEES